MENRVNIGELDTLVTFYRVNQTIGEQGERKTTAEAVATVYANVTRYVSESVSDDNYEAEKAYTVVTYAVQGLSTRWRVQIGDQFYEVTRVSSVARWSPFVEMSVRSVED